MERRVALIATIIAALVALGAAAYAYKEMSQGSLSSPAWTVTRPGPRYPYMGHGAPWQHPWGLGRHGPWAWHHPCRPWHVVADRYGHYGPRIVVSKEFREHVLEILMHDNCTAALLRQGYNITVIKPVIEGVVQADGTVSLRAVKAIVVLHEAGGSTRGAALVVVDLVGGKVVKVIERQVTVWGQSG